jgi:hypothetical protein
MAGQKIRIRLKSYDHEVIDSSARKRRVLGRGQQNHHISNLLHHESVPLACGRAADAGSGASARHPD